MFIYHLDSGCQNQMGMMGGRKEKRRQENCSTLSLLACVRTYVSTLTLTHTGGITITTFSNGNAYNFVLLPINAKQTDNTISSFYSLCVSTHTLFFLCSFIIFIVMSMDRDRRLHCSIFVHFNGIIYCKLLLLSLCICCANIHVVQGLFFTFSINTQYTSQVID